MCRKLFGALRFAAASLALALLGQSAAQAGLVSGKWDPQFGSFLPGLNWQVRAELLVPDACSSQGGSPDQVYATLSGPCSGSMIEAIWLRLFDTGADPNDFFASSAGLPVTSAYWNWCDTNFSDPHCFNHGSYFGGISNVRVAYGQVVGLDTVNSQNATSSVPPNSWPSMALGNNFQLSFDVNGPILECVTCGNGVFADKQDLTQFLVTYNSDGIPKFIDSNGNALGAVLNSSGEYLGQAPVPEPGALALVVAGLAALGVSRRRRG